MSSLYMNKVPFFILTYLLFPLKHSNDQTKHQFQLVAANTWLNMLCAGNRYAAANYEAAG